MEMTLNSKCLKKLVGARNKIKDDSTDNIDDWYLNACRVFCNFFNKCPLYRKGGTGYVYINPKLDQEIHDFISDHTFLPVKDDEIIREPPPLLKQSLTD